MSSASSSTSKTRANYRELRHLHTKLRGAAAGDPPIHFTPEDLDRARTAKALLQLDGALPVITDLDL